MNFVHLAISEIHYRPEVAIVDHQLIVTRTELKLSHLTDAASVNQRLREHDAINVHTVHSIFIGVDVSIVSVWELLSNVPAHLSIVTPFDLRLSLINHLTLLWC